MGVKSYKSDMTRHFSQEGNGNLRDVLRFVQRALRKRVELREMKIVFITGFGEGPVLATTMLREYQPKIVAVALPPRYVEAPDGSKRHLGMSDEIRAYLLAMKVNVISGRLPFEPMEMAVGQAQDMKLISAVMSRTARSLPLCVQAVLQACDFGCIGEGERVIAIAGDLAAIISASSSRSFLAQNSSFFIHEFLCKSSEYGAIRPRAEIVKYHRTIDGPGGPND